MLFFLCVKASLVLTIQLLDPSVTVAVDKYWNVTVATGPIPFRVLGILHHMAWSSSDDAYIENGGNCNHLLAWKIAGDLTLLVGALGAELLNRER